MNISHKFRLIAAEPGRDMVQAQSSLADELIKEHSADLGVHLFPGQSRPVDIGIAAFGAEAAIFERSDAADARHVTPAVIGCVLYYSGVIGTPNRRQHRTPVIFRVYRKGGRPMTALAPPRDVSAADMELAWWGPDGSVR